MRIDRLRIENFKGFELKDFSFHPQMNLIVGVNGAGKTSLLDALAVAAGAWLLGIRGYDTRNIRPHDVRLNAIPGYNTAMVNWESQFPCVVHANGLVFGQTVEWKRSLTTPGGRTTRGDSRNIRNLAANADRAVRAGEASVLPLLSYYGTGRLWDTPREQYLVKDEKGLVGKQSLSRLEGYRNSLDPRVSIPTLAKWIARQSWIAYQSGGPSHLYSTVRSAILACIEEAHDLYFDAARGEVVLKIGTHGLQPFSNLSDGQKALVALVGDMAQKAATLNPSLDERVLEDTPGMVLIDELDLHLHPGWQRRVIEDLRRVFPRIQFFAATHSPFLIQSLRSGEELLMLDGLATAELGNKTLDDIAQGIMGVPHPEVSQRYGQMKQTATEYLETLDQAALAPEDKRKQFEERLSESIAPYADNPAFQAFLEMKRAAKLRD